MADSAAVNGAPAGKTSISKDSESAAANGAASSPTNANNKAVDQVLYSDIAIHVLLVKLKQSIASARDFAAFLKRRSALEEDHATGLRKLSRITNDSTSRLEARQGSYAQNLASVTQLHERMAENGMEFASSLHKMHEDLNELATNMDRSRKHWKQEGLNNEKRVKDAEGAMEKAKARYESNADSYDRARTGDTSGRSFGIKGPKSAEQREEDLLRKAQAADQDYKAKVEGAQLARKENQDSLRPQAIKQLQELVRECDSALVLQLQKFATFNERLLVGNGMVISPHQELADGKISTPSMREMVQGIDNEKDFHMFVTSHASQVPSKTSEIKYEKHSALGGAPASSPTATRPRGASQATSSSAAAASQPQPPASQSQPSPSSTQLPSSTSQAAPSSSLNSRQPTAPATSTTPAASAGLGAGSVSSSPTVSTPQNSGFQPGRQQTGPPDRSFRGPSSGHPSASSSGPSPTTHSAVPPQQVPQKAPSSGSPSQYQPSQYRPSGAPPTGPPGNAWNEARHQQGPVQQGPYQHPPRGASITTNGPPSAAAATSPTGPPSYPESAMPPSHLQPYNRVFGVKLDELFRRDDSAVPLVVYQCIQAVDLFGLDTEGIYRTSGNVNHIAQLRAQFDHDSSKIDFRDPQNFFHDVNSVAGLLKFFFRDLPDPMFTAEHYQEFIDAAKIEDATTRRDNMHAIINDLPDPNYATLRAVALHLWRVQEHGEQNRMNVQSLAICFAPTMMGGAMGLGHGKDTALQARVVQTVLENTFMIFDED